MNKTLEINHYTPAIHYHCCWNCKNSVKDNKKIICQVHNTEVNGHYTCDVCKAQI